MGEKTALRMHRNCAYIACATALVRGLAVVVASAGIAHAEETMITHAYDGERWVPFEDGMTVGAPPLFKGVADYDSESNVDCATVDVLCSKPGDSKGTHQQRSIDFIISTEEQFSPAGVINVVFYRIDASGAFWPHESDDGIGLSTITLMRPCTAYFVYDFVGTYDERALDGGFGISDARLIGSFWFDPGSITSEGQKAGRNIIQDMDNVRDPSASQYSMGHVPDWVWRLAAWHDAGLVTGPQYESALQFLAESGIIEIPGSRTTQLCDPALDQVGDAASKHPCDKMWTVSPEGYPGCVAWHTAMQMENHGWRALDGYIKIPMAGLVAGETPSAKRDSSSPLTAAFSMTEPPQAGQNTTVLLDISAADIRQASVSASFQIRITGDVEVVSSDPPLSINEQMTRDWPGQTFDTPTITMLPGESRQITVVVVPVWEDDIIITATGYDEHGNVTSPPISGLYFSFWNQAADHRIDKGVYVTDPHTEYIWTEHPHPQCWSTPWFDTGQTVQDYYRDRGISVLDMRRVPYSEPTCNGCECMGGSILLLTPTSDQDVVFDHSAWFSDSPG